MKFLNDRRGFTMIELMVVIGMLLLLTGAVTSSISAAHRRAKIQQATTVAQGMTQAILAYENFGETSGGGTFKSPLSEHLMERGEATESAMAFILGQEKRKDGQNGNIPVLFNASITAGSIRDPWGNPFYVTIRTGTVTPDDSSHDLQTAVSFPNFNRIPADQR